MSAKKPRMRPAVGTPAWERAAIAKVRRMRLALERLATELQRRKIGDSAKPRVDGRSPAADIQ